MLIEIHILQNHAPSNLNRDDTGSPKECVFGNVRRARISSQCLKRSIRRSEIFQNALDGDGLATRTRRLPELIRERFRQEGLDDYAETAAQKASGFGTSNGKERPPEKDGNYATAQTMFLTQADIDAVAETLLGAAREAKTPKAFADKKAAELQQAARQKGFRPVSADVALFGRMTTSEALRDVEAACQVAHALSTHKVEHEFDYFTAVDDLKGSGEDEEDAGADMLGDVEFNSACYYKYFAVDVAGLIDNLSGAKIKGHTPTPEDVQRAQDVAARAIEAMLKAACLTTPTGKQNSFAAHQLPAAVLVEVRPQRTPVSYANAFVDAARPGGGDDLVMASLRKLGRHVEALTRGFDLQSQARWLLAPEHAIAIEGVEAAPSLNGLCAQLRAVIANGHATA